MAVSISGHRGAHLGCMNTAKLCLVTSADAGPGPFTQCIVARSRPPECICVAWTSSVRLLLQDTIPGWQCLGISRHRAGTALNGCMPDDIIRQREDSLHRPCAEHAGCPSSSYRLSMSPRRHEDTLHARLNKHLCRECMWRLAGGVHACMASPIWKAMWSAGTLTCTTLPCWSLTYSPAALSRQGTSCPCFKYMALASPACADCLMRSPFQTSPAGALTCPTLPRWSLIYVTSLCAGKGALRQQGGALTVKRRVRVIHQAAVGQHLHLVQYTLFGQRCVHL